MLQQEREKLWSQVLFEETVNFTPVVTFGGILKILYFPLKTFLKTDSKSNFSRKLTLLLSLNHLIDTGSS